MLESIQITLPDQRDAITRLAKSGDWATVRRRLGNELKPIETQTSALVRSIDQEARGELGQALENVTKVQTIILFIVPATAISTFCIAAFLGWSVARRIIEPRLAERVNERTRIARDLHGTPLQSFQGLMLRLRIVDDLLPDGRAKDQLEKALEGADQALAEGRKAVYDLRSSSTITNDMAAAVRMLGDEMSTQDSAAFHLVIEGSAGNLHPTIRYELYRIAREAIRHAFSHAGAHDIEAEITYGERAFRPRIRDDGVGIPNEVLEQGRPGHYGLPGMRERAKQIGARLNMWSKAGAGTEIEWTIAAAIAYDASTRRYRFGLFRKEAG